MSLPMCCSTMSANDVVIAAEDQQFDRVVRAGSEDLVRVVERHDVVVGTVHEQHRAAHPRDGGDRRDVVEAMTDGSLHVVEDVAPDRTFRDSLRRQPPPHHRGGMRKRRHAHDRRHVRSARSGKERGARADRVPDQRDAPGVDLRAGREPLEARAQVFGEARERREAVVVARAVTAGVDEQRREAGVVQRSRKRQHHRRVAAPAVHHDHRRSGCAGCAVPARSASRAGGAGWRCRCARSRSARSNAAGVRSCGIRGAARPARMPRCSSARSSASAGDAPVASTGQRWRDRRPSQSPSAAYHRRSRMPGDVV